MCVCIGQGSVDKIRKQVYSFKNSIKKITVFGWTCVCACVCVFPELKLLGK